MSLYRQAGRASGRTVLIAAATALVVGLLAGFLLGRSTAPKPSLAERVGDLRTSLAPAREGLELAATEYGQAVRSGRVVAPTEYAAAKSDVQRASDTIATHAAGIRALSATRAAALDRAMAVLRNGVSRRADPATVRRLSDAASAALRAAGGGGTAAATARRVSGVAPECSR
jgi:DNA-binding transcriptional regulator YdaS (Cro superfamily)